MFGYLKKSTDAVACNGVVFVGEIKQEIIELVNKVDDPKALRTLYSFMRGFLNGLKEKEKASRELLLK